MCDAISADYSPEFLRQRAGEQPSFSEKVLVKWLGDKKPERSEISRIFCSGCYCMQRLAYCMRKSAIQSRKVILYTELIYSDR